MGSKHTLWGMLGVAAFGAPSVAHHNAGVVYDLTQVRTVEGKVTRFELGNPHVRIYFTRSDGVGAEGAEWMAEGGSRTVLLRRGWTTDMLKPGDTVTIVSHPAREAINAIHMEQLTLPDGRTIWAEDVPAPDKVQALISRRPAGTAAPSQE